MIKKVNVTGSDGLVGRIIQGGNFVNTGDLGVLFQQYKAGTALASSVVETSLWTLTAVSPQIVGNAAQVATVSTVPIPVFPPNWLTLGTQLRGRLYGTIANTGTPTIQVRVVLKNSAGTVVYALADTTAITMSTITGTTELFVEFDSIVSAVGTSGSITSRAGISYGTTATTASVFLRQAAAAVTVDTTQSYSLDVMATWGTSSASNTLNIAVATIEVL